MKLACAEIVMVKMFSKVEMAADLKRCSVYIPLLKSSTTKISILLQAYASLLAMFMFFHCRDFEKIYDLFRKLNICKLF